MSSLAQKMISDVQAETTAKLAAIEASVGKIEEAETLAATLRSFGIAGARALGFSGSTGVLCWVTLPHDITGTALCQALADADLKINRIEPDGPNCDIFFDGLDVAISARGDIANGLITTWPGIITALQSTEEPAHA